MATGDLQGSVRKLEQGLRLLNYPRDIDYNGLAKGDPAAFLPIISYAFTSYSTYVTEQLIACGVELAGKNDLRFLDAVYKILRDQFQYKPLLLKDQFLHTGFAERKIQLSCDIISIVTKKHKELSSLNKVKAHPNKNSSCPIKVQSRLRCETLTPDTLPSEPNVTIKPLVERHLSNDCMKTICISSSPKNEVIEDKPLVRREYMELPTSHESQALEIGMLKHQIAKCEEKLQVLDVVQTKLQALECATAGKVIIDARDWNNLLSRVVLLETQLLLHSRQNDASYSISGNEECTSCQMMNRNSSDKEMRVETPESLSHQSSGYNSLLSADESPKAANINSLCLTEVMQTNTVKHKVERISKMIEETAELLKCTEISTETHVAGPLLSQKQDAGSAEYLK